MQDILEVVRVAPVLVSVCTVVEDYHGEVVPVGLAHLVGLELGVVGFGLGMGVRVRVRVRVRVHRAGHP